MEARDVQNIRLMNLSKSYGQVAAVQTINLEVGAGEFVSILGPSGCGKTTILRMIAGFVEPTAGSIYIGNRDITTLPAYRRNVGLVFQSYALWPHMTVEGNIAFGLKIQGVRGAELARKVDRSLEATSLSGLGKRFPRELSGGQQQRVALARALVLDPPVMLLDEPLSNLDRKLRVVMRKELKELQSRLGMTTLYVTHDQDEALSMSDRVAVMNAGQLVRFAKPRELYDDPQIDFIAEFVGSTNIFNGRVSNRNEKTARVTISDGFDLLIEADDTLQVGEPVKLLVRPERILISSNLIQGENVLQSKVTFVDYFGPMIRYTVQLVNGQELTVEHTNLQVAMSLGDDVSIAIRPDSLKRLCAAGLK